MPEDVNPSFRLSELANLGQHQELDLQEHQPGAGEGLVGLQCPEDSPRAGVGHWKSDWPSLLFAGLDSFILGQHINCLWTK